MENKKGRKPYPVEMRCVTTSLRLRPDRLAKYKELGGVKWLNDQIDKERIKDFNNAIKSMIYK
jgi:hypothetical protein